MKFHMIDITYVALHMRAQTKKTTFSCKDDCGCILEWGKGLVQNQDCTRPELTQPQLCLLYYHAQRPVDKIYQFSNPPDNQTATYWSPVTTCISFIKFRCSSITSAVSIVFRTIVAISSGQDLYLRHLPVYLTYVSLCLVNIGS